MKTLRAAGTALLAVAGIADLAGCNQIGPTGIRTARTDFNSAIQYTGKQQLLLNMLRLSKDDPPLFLDITQVTDGMKLALTGTGNYGYGLPTSKSPGGNYGLGGTAEYDQTPTITYVPVSGDNLAKTLMSPVSVDGIVAMYNSGWPIGILMSVVVNRFGDTLVNDPLHPDVRTDFFAMLTDLENLQNAGALQLTVVKAELNDDKDKTPKGPDSLGVRIVRMGHSTDAAFDHLIDILKSHGFAGVEASRQKNVLSLLLNEKGDAKAGSDTIAVAIKTRSFVGALQYVMLLQQCPLSGPSVPTLKPAITFEKSIAPKFDVYVDCWYQGSYFYIPNDPGPSAADSRRTFTLLSQLMALQGGTLQNTGVLLTIPAHP